MTTPKTYDLNDINSLFADEVEEDLGFVSIDDDLDEVGDEIIFKGLNSPKRKKCIICDEFGCNGECCDLG